MAKSLLIIGGSGFLSGEVARRSVVAGQRVTVLTRGKRPVPRGVAAINCDRTDSAAMKRELQGKEFDGVIDCIGYRPSDVRATLAALGGRVGHYVFISTDFVYRPGPRNHQLPITEDAPLDTQDGYGRDKRRCEEVLLRVLRAHRARGHLRHPGVAVTILRPPHILGPGAHLGAGSWHGRDPMLLDMLRKGVPVIVLDDGMLLIQPVMHRDIADAALAVLAPGNLGVPPRNPGVARRNPEASSLPSGLSLRVEDKSQASSLLRGPGAGVYNIAGPTVLTIREYYELVGQAIGCRVRFLSLPSSLYVAANPRSASHARHRVYDRSRLAADTGFTPGRTAQQGIAAMVRWLERSGAAKPYAPRPREAQLRAMLTARDRQVGALLRTME